jgi:hypothetical protein
LTLEGNPLRTCCLALLIASSSQVWTLPAVAQTAVAQTAVAQTAVPPEYREPLVDVHAFVSQGFIKSTDNEYLAKSRRGSFEFSEVGVNLTRALGDKLRVGMQLFTRDVGPIGNYGARFDWFGLDYHFFDWLGVRAGRTKLPYGLYNETSDVDAARVPVLLPQSVYSPRPASSSTATFRSVTWALSTTDCMGARCISTWEIYRRTARRSPTSRT